ERSGRRKAGAPETHLPREPDSGWMRAGGGAGERRGPCPSISAPARVDTNGQTERNSAAEVQDQIARLVRRPGADPHRNAALYEEGERTASANRPSRVVAAEEVIHGELHIVSASGGIERQDQVFGGRVGVPDSRGFAGAVRLEASGR